MPSYGGRSILIVLSHQGKKETLRLFARHSGQCSQWNSCYGFSLYQRWIPLHSNNSLVPTLLSWPIPIHNNPACSYLWRIPFYSWIGVKSTPIVYETGYNNYIYSVVVSQCYATRTESTNSIVSSTLDLKGLSGEICFAESGFSR
jgi:hypothetical protein